MISASAGSLKTVSELSSRVIFCAGSGTLLISSITWLTTPARLVLLGYFLMNSSAALSLAAGSAAVCTFVMASCSPFETCGALLLSCAEAMAANAATSAHTANTRLMTNDLDFMNDLVECGFQHLIASARLERQKTFCGIAVTIASQHVCKPGVAKGSLFFV